LSSNKTGTKFIVDANAGKLARWLRMLGYDTLFVNDIDDDELVSIGLKEHRLIITKDTQVMLRRAVTSGKVKALLVTQDDPKAQFRQLVDTLKLNRGKQFTRCLECNALLVPRGRDEVEGLVPPYVFQTQTQYYQCPECQRVYWRATHWQHMIQELDTLLGQTSEAQNKPAGEA
jgi:uncharacterized protein with PIN domain